MTKYIFVTGGVVSSLGKGLTSASIGLLLESRGLKVAIQKLDPYINVDPGTMSPFQHGEVYVTDDGAETDLDLGHYERFTNCKLSKDCNYTTGKIYYSVIAKERAGSYLGRTVQVVPHITDEIKSAILALAQDKVDVIITEIGGTVGDIESLPFLEAIRQFSLDQGRDNVLYIHLTLLPYLRTSGEIKTKPTQHSVGKLREIGIQPDILITRCEKPLNKEIKSKISLFCNVDIPSVIEEKDVDNTIYEVPLIFVQQKLDNLIVKKLGLKTKDRDLRKWAKMVKVITSLEKETEIALVGKYVSLHDSYKSIYEALTHAGIANNVKVSVRKVDSEQLEKDPPRKHLGGVKGILVPGGFGERGIEGKINAVKYAREKRIPFFGICLGMQCATVEFARNVCGLKRADSTEFNPDTPHPVICLLEEQRQVVDKGGTMRLGAYLCHVKRGTKVYKAYGKEVISERHRHRYEFNNSFRNLFESRGLIVSGEFKEKDIGEIIELKGHPWFVGVQFHPEFKSKPVSVHPLFRDFIKAGLAVRSPSRKKKARRAEK